MTPQTNGAMRLRVALELVESESRYLSSVRVLQQVFAAPLRQSLGAQTFLSVFSNIADIERVSAEVLADLSDRINVSSFPDHDESDESDDSERGERLCLGASLLRLVPFLKLYTAYCNNFGSALQTVSTLMATHSEFKRVLTDAARNPRCGKLRLDSYLILPIQRIPRYTMLIDKLVKYTGRNHLDYECLVKARDLTAEIASFINNQIHEHAQAQQMLVIQRSLVSFPHVLIAPGRRLLHSGRVMKICRRSDQARFLFLFTDCIVYTMPVPGDMYVFHRCLWLRNVEVKGMTCRSLSSSSDEALQHTFQILSPDKSFAAYTDSARSTEEWIRKINNAVVELKSARRSLKTGSEGEDDVNLAPVWLPNKLAASCMICQEAFTWMTRKHHCRKCGNIVCASCSRNRVPGIGTNMLVRACNSCCPQRLIVTSPEPISIQQETQNDYDDVETEEGDSVRSFLSGCGVGMVRARSSRWSVVGGSEMGRDGGGSQRSLMSFIGGSTGGGGGGERRTSIVDMERGGSFGSLLSFAGVGAKCGLCSVGFGLLIGGGISCCQCERLVCGTCLKGGICDACVRGVKPEDVKVFEGGWSCGAVDDT